MKKIPFALTFFLKTCGFFSDFHTKFIYQYNSLSPFTATGRKKIECGGEIQISLSLQSPREKEALSLTHVTEESRRVKDVCAV